MDNQYYYSTEIEWIRERNGDLSAPNLPDTTFLAIAENSKLNFVSLRSARMRGS